MPPGELNTEQEQIRLALSRAPGENGHKYAGRDFLFSAFRSDLRNASGWKQSWDWQRASQAGLGESPRRQGSSWSLDAVRRLGKVSGSWSC